MRLLTDFILLGKNKSEASDPKLGPLPEKIKKFFCFR
jgi:hypothetical protein